MSQTQHYILFHNHTEGLALYSLLKKEGFRARIAPAPRSAVSCCGMSLLVDPEDIAAVSAFIEEGGLEIDRIIELDNQFNPNRDAFC